MSVPQTAKTPTDYDNVDVKPNGRGEDDFWDVAREVERWWMLFRRNNRMHALPKSKRIEVTIDHHDYTEVLGVIPASIWKRNTTLKVAVWRQGQPKRTGYLTYHAAESKYRFVWAKTS